MAWCFFFFFEPIIAVYSRRSQEVLLLARARVLVEMPFGVAILIVQSSTPYFEGPKAHSGSDLTELARIVGCADKHVMSHFNDIVYILEGDNSAALGLLGCWWQRREQVLQDLDYPFTGGCGEALENEVRVAFRDGAAQAIGDVAAQNDIVEGERNCWPVWQVGDGHRGRCSSVLMQ